MRIAVVKAARDKESDVWCVEHSDVEGLRVEGETFAAFCRNVASAVADPLEDENDGEDIPIEIIAHASSRARVAGLPKAFWKARWSLHLRAATR
jgi:hypothetical protein